ncbi:DUF2552 family protein [Ectobacillus panaciterrae]|uniref:DUF2552 family protein n=1 Tax=Ectobacillus panaciterrae TaxID=363872 RepID=UPI00041C2F62|nr:DUF2552 family protein [Ectobacillus panaciterrae]
MNEKMNTLKTIAQERTWVSFLNNNHPYSLLHWSIAGVQKDQKDVWLLQDEVTFETKEFANIDQAVAWIDDNMQDVTDVLA